MNFDKIKYILTKYHITTIFLIPFTVYCAYYFFITRILFIFNIFFNNCLSTSIKLLAFIIMINKMSVTVSFNTNYFILISISLSREIYICNLHSLIKILTANLFIQTV